jgi:hypothetical protein
MSTLKNLTCRKNTFQKVTQFSQINNVLDAPDSNTDGFFFSRDTCVFQLSCICLFGTKRAYLHIENPKLHEEFLSKKCQFLQGNNVLVVPGSYTSGFISRDTYVSSAQLNRPI